MIYDDVILLNSANIQTANIESGTTFPISPTAGRIFYLSTTLDLAHDKGLYYYDGTAWQTGSISGITNGFGILGSGTSGNITLSLDKNSIPYDIASGVVGKPTASQVILKFKAPRPFTVAANMSGSQSVAGVAATSSSVFIVRKNSTQISTFTFAASGTIATWSTQAAVSFATGDILDITAPGSVDSTLSDIYFTISAVMA